MAGKKRRPPSRSRSPHACHFASQSTPEKSFAATSPHLGCCNKLKKSLRVIRGHLGTLRLGRNSATSGDSQLTAQHDVFGSLIAEVFSWTKPDVCRVDRRRLAAFVGADRLAPARGYPSDRRRQFVRLKPTVAAYPRATSRVPVASPYAGSQADRCRKRVIAPPTESLRWPETPSSVRQTPLRRIY